MPDTLLTPDAPAALLEASPSLKSYRSSGATSAYLEWTKGAELDDMTDDCTFIALHHPANVTQAARAILGSPNAANNGATLQYIRQQSAAYRFQVAYSTTAGQYNTQNCIIGGEWNWVAVVHRWVSGGAGTRVAGWHAVGLNGNWRPFTFASPIEPVGTPVSDSGRPLRILANVTPSGASFEGDLALVAVFRRRLRLEEIEDFRGDPLSWASEAAFFVRPGHAGLSVFDEGKNKKGQASVTGTLVGPAPTGVDRFWWPSQMAAEAAALFLNTLAGGVTPSGALTRRANTLRAGASTPSAVVQKEARGARAGSLTPAGALTSLKVVLQSLAGTITSSGARVQQIIGGRSGSLTPSGTRRSEARASRSAGLTPSGQRLSAVVRASAGAITFAGAVVGTLIVAGATAIYRFAAATGAPYRFRAAAGATYRFIARHAGSFRFRARPEDTP